MSEFRIFVDLGGNLPPGSSLTRDSFPLLSEAVTRVGEAALARWQGFAQGMPLPDGRRIGNRTGGYLRSIMLSQVNDFTVEVYSVLPYAKGIEEGMPARDMKRMLGSSWKVRVNSKGKRYLIIPFRHDAPGSVMGNAMPQGVYDWWQVPGRVESRVTSTYNRISGAEGSDIRTRRPMTVAGWTYKWGSRLGKAELKRMGFGEGAVRRLSGMVNFREKGENPRHSQYITFRVMSEDSKGWQAKATEGFWPARTVAEQLRPVAEKAFATALQGDVKRMLSGE